MTICLLEVDTLATIVDPLPLPATVQLFGAPVTVIVSTNNPQPPSAPTKAVEVFGQHVIEQLNSHRAGSLTSNTRAKTSGGTLGQKNGSSIPPLFVAMQGPQGSGKTTVTRALVDYLSSHGYSTGVLSMDDLYHTHSNLERVAAENPDNPLLQGRGQPGTHDIQFGTALLDQIRAINTQQEEQEQANIKIPVFDKSLFGGQGDRADPSTWPSLSPPLDVFILEGWSMGFSPIPHDQVLSKRNSPPSSSSSPGSGSDSGSFGGPQQVLSQYTEANLLQINQNLTEYQAWYTHFSVFLQLRPTDLHHVYTWRLQQEHAMKARNGGQGMSDDQVKSFVDRYMPGYYLFLDTIQKNEAWKGRSITVTIDLDRTCIDQHDW
ncbi:P-loop containing nucleoside triphosphate hydrolase protein [Testicularia cyperi]|uniref:P-loop containing nucleoside triphosphate hydrolase protein n=1 Tax=Testicularia cyperi TaxID=1882483 RepID=A0A317XM81_9BASI|nr:P-loop containing nucleoside triphosphate hydrolase protein [Testicularia cyperi]